MQTAVIAASSSGDNTIVAAYSDGGCIAVVGFVLSFGGTVNAKFRSFNSTSSTDTDLSGLFYGVANTQVPSPALPRSIQRPGYHFVTKSGESLQLNLSGAVAVGGYVIYERLSANA